LKYAPCLKNVLTYYVAATLLAMQSAVLPTAIPSVRPSVTLESRGIYCEVAKHSSFLTPTMVGERRSLPPKICAQSDSRPSEKRRLRPIFAYKVSAISAIEKSSIIANRKSTTRFQTSDRWSAYVIPNTPKGGSKINVSFLWIKINLNWINSATKFLCVKTYSSKVVAEPFPSLTLYIHWG